MSNFNVDGVKYVVVEGIDAAGKDTIVDYIRDTVIKYGKQPIVVNHGYSTEEGKLIIEGIKKGNGDPNTEIKSLFKLWNHIALNIACDINDLIKEGIDPNNIVVILNRFTMSTYVYQCIMKRGSISYFNELNDAFKAKFNIDFTILLKCSQRVQLQRLKAREAMGLIPDVSERNCNVNHNKMLNSYMSRFYAINDSGVIIDTDYTLTIVKSNVLQALIDRGVVSEVIAEIVPTEPVELKEITLSVKIACEKNYCNTTDIMEKVEELIGVRYKVLSVESVE